MSQNGQNNNKDPRYQEPTFQQYCSDPKAPRSYLGLILAGVKKKIVDAIKGLPSRLVMMVLMTVLTTVFNVYFWAVLNDTMWAGEGPLGRISFMPYLIGGGVYSGYGYKGVTPFEVAGITATGKAVAPLTLALSLLYARIKTRKKQLGKSAVSQDLASVKGLRGRYEKELGIRSGSAADKTGKEKSGGGYIDLSNLGNNAYMRMGLCCAFIFGFIIRNPFAVPVFAILLYFSFGQGGQSDLGQTFFRLRSADGKVHSGDKAAPRYSECMLIMYYMSIGLFMYAVINVVLWIFFNFNFYIRLIVSAVLVFMIFTRGGSKKQQAAGMVSTILLVAGGAVLFGCLTVLADDNGWSESGRTIGGLISNSGFPKSAWSAFLPALFWDLGILFGWPNDDPMPQAPPENPYDFPGRPDSWSLNDEGDISFIDPVTGKRSNYGLTGYDENGNPIYIGDNGSYYDLDELLVNYDNAASHSEYFKDANRGLDEWLKQQRAENQKLSRDGMAYLEDKWKREAEQAKQEKEAENLFKMWMKYGGDLDDKESIRRAAEKAIGKAQKDSEYYRDVGEFWDNMTTTAEVTEKLADYTLTGYTILTGDSSVKTVYDRVKKYASKMSDAYANDKSMKMAILSATTENLVDYASGGLGDKGWHFTGNIGSEVVNKAWSNLEEGKDWNDGMTSAVVTGTFKGTVDKVASALNNSQEEYTNDIFRRDRLALNRAQNEGMPKKQTEALKDMMYRTRASNKEAEKALHKTTEAFSEVTKRTYDTINEGIDKYSVDTDARDREAFLKEVAERKNQYNADKKAKAIREAEKKLKEHRDAIRRNAQKPLK